ncbi:NotI family restriction endonuclease [Treponema endosymbiont of Eucomonympha sp.]|uniref:NotI family restriction endonuclease n=1 Tax=Treponema endosymbiont of Eucomonympha sp. TaxID=1580831 RepID=UPI0007865B5D|nr:NotI family restriction endonuclease [Treponema endosymbiont of Eucomonympha sp.]
MNKIVELFGIHTEKPDTQWDKIIEAQVCPYSNKQCYKVRKSQPNISIGTCTVRYGQADKSIIICPNRLLQNRKVFMDCIHLLHLHQPGNDIHVISELSIPGGSVDYVLASVKNGKVLDFAGLEFQTLDTTGTVWPERQKFLSSCGIAIQKTVETKMYGMNWKMTAKTILVQLHHKLSTFENLQKHLVLIIQDDFLEYMGKEFNLKVLNKPAVLGDSLQFHSYSISGERDLSLQLKSRTSTNSVGIAECLGLNAEKNVELETILKTIERKLSDLTLLKI